MNQADIEAYAQPYQKAVRDILAPAKYYRKDDIDLERTADIAPWKATDEILKMVKNADDLPISIIDDQTDLTEVLSRLILHREVGLVLLGEQIGARKRPVLIVISTISQLYVIEPHHSRGIEFLKQCLQVEDINFWTTWGHQEACCLLNQYNISLKGSNAKCCLGMHLNMMKFLSAGPNVQTNDIKFYPERAILHAKHQPKRLERFERLVYLWLDLDDTRNIDCDPSQFKHLSKRPLSLTAMNLIRKRCTLVVPLAERLVNFETSEFNRMNKNAMNVLINARNDMGREKIKKRLKEWEKCKIVSPVYFQHLDQVER